MVLAVDAAGGQERMELTRTELADLGTMPWAAGLPLVVVATKVAVPGAMEAVGVEDSLRGAASGTWGGGTVDGNDSNGQRRRWITVPCNAASAGDVDVQKVLQIVTGS